MSAPELKQVVATPMKTPAPAPYTNPYFGIAGVFLGAGIATLNARLVSVGLPDLRGAKGFGFDEAAWIPTVLNMATMFSGVFVVFVNALFGPRPILLPAAVIFTLASSLLPLVPGYWALLALTVIAGLSAGTFYSLTLTFVLTALPKRLIIFGIAAYAADIVFISNIASMIELLQRGGAKVALAGISLPPQYGTDYIGRFDAMYPALAKQFHLPLLPFLLQNVYGVDGDIQPDGVHPTAQGAKQVAANVQKLIQPMLRK